MQRMMELAPLRNGAHRNQTFHGVLPEGWALVPEELATENFPFGTVTAEALPGPGGEGGAVMTVTGWTPLPVPEQKPEAAPAPTVWEALDAAYQEGVNDV